MSVSVSFLWDLHCLYVRISVYLDLNITDKMTIYNYNPCFVNRRKTVFYTEYYEDYTMNDEE